MARPRKGKAKVRVYKSGKRVSYGQAGKKAKPGTKAGDRYCARSDGQMKRHKKAAKDPTSPLRLSRKDWGCAGKKSKPLKKSTSKRRR